LTRFSSTCGRTGRSKHFTAYDPVAKWTLGHVATAASASAARDLLDTLIASAPFTLRGIQVDGGSEFMSVFEDHRRNYNLELFTLPPRRPDLNGCVERAQSAWRSEFYASYDLPARIDKLHARRRRTNTTNTGHTRLLATSLPPSISNASVRRPAV
jgi:hypothetical protein